MKTADEYRQEFLLEHGRPVPAASFLSDVLATMEEWEAEVRFLALQAAIGLELEREQD